MDMSGEYRIAAPREKVWQALNDPAILKQCIPGCESLEKLSDTEMNGKVTAKVGPVTARFGGKVTLSDLDPPNSYRISGEGTGGPAGFAKGGATVSLSDDSGATVLNYKVDANVGGKLAQIGSRLIDGTARKMADDFFARFAGIVGAPAEATPVAPAETAPPAAEAPAPTAEPAAASAASEPLVTEGRITPNKAATASFSPLTYWLWGAAALLVAAAIWLVLR
jgi:carbon monoxide dehydrogenase subunit G